MKNLKTSEIKKTQNAVEQAMRSVISYLKETQKPTSEEAHRIIDDVLTQNDCESPEGHMSARKGSNLRPSA